MSLCITPLPYKLRIFTINKIDLPYFTHFFINILTSLDTIKFFNYTENNNTISCIISSVGFNLLSTHSLESKILIGPNIWKAIIVSEGHILNTCVVSLVSEVLALAGYPILYISANTTDYVLVIESQFNDVMKCLSEKFTIINGVSNDMINIERNEKISLVKTDILYNIDTTVDVSKSQLKLKLISDRLVLTSIKCQDFDNNFRKLIRLFLFPNKSRFFSFLCHEEDLSLMTDIESFNELALTHGVTNEMASWYAIEVVGEFAFNETGLVWSVSAPLALAGISPFYMSSFYTGFILVAEDRLEEVKLLLNQKFAFIE